MQWEDGKDVLGSEAIQSEGELLINAYPESSNIPLQRGKETLMVNASIMDGNYKADNAPWLIDLDLPLGPRL